MLHPLRTTRRFARFALVWFGMALGAAVASPLLHVSTDGGAMRAICSSDGTLRQAVSPDGAELNAAHVHALDCPLCTGPAIFASSAVARAEMAFCDGALPLRAFTSPLTRQAGASLPPRGPPA
ncbi:MAG: hypothetical protein EOO27_34165 [Comamonadaceae bacterium]|nr:MAG: hypothetical protein EOO27_34165 [Comamonadaceae bacterium]